MRGVRLDGGREPSDRARHRGRVLAHRTHRAACEPGGSTCVLVFAGRRFGGVASVRCASLGARRCLGRAVVSRRASLRRRRFRGRPAVFVASGYGRYRIFRDPCRMRHGGALDVVAHAERADAAHRALRRARRAVRMASPRYRRKTRWSCSTWGREMRSSCEAKGNRS